MFVWPLKRKTLKFDEMETARTMGTAFIKRRLLDARISEGLVIPTTCLERMRVAETPADVWYICDKIGCFVDGWQAHEDHAKKLAGLI